MAQGEVQVLDPMLLGVRIRLHPEEKDLAPEVGTGLYVDFEPWMGSLELGPAPGEIRVGLGLRVGQNLVWTASYRSGSPSLGLSWRLWLLEVRGWATQHPLLGTVSRVQIVLGVIPS